MKLTKKQIANAKAMAAQLQEEASAEYTVRENLVNILRMHTLDIDAEDIVDRLCDGIRQFHELYEKAEHQNVQTVICNEMDGLLAQLPQEKQQEMLNGLVQTFSGMTEQEMAELGTQGVQTLKEKVCEYISEYGLNHLDPDALQMITDIDADTLEKMLQTSASEELEQYTALASYMLVINGDWDDMTPEMIGTSVAAASVTQRSMLDVLRGKINMEQLKRILKIVAGILLIALIIHIAVSLMEVSNSIFWVGKVFMQLDSGLFHYGMMNVLAALIVKTASIAGGFVAVYRVAERFGLIQAATELGQKLRAFIEEKIAPAAKCFWNDLQVKVDRLRTNVRAAADTTEEHTTETAPVEEAQAVAYC